MFYLGSDDFSGNVAISWFSGLAVSNGDFASLFFQAAFVATIVSGAFAERAKFGVYVVFSIIISGLIYPYLGSWTWGRLVVSNGFPRFCRLYNSAECWCLVWLLVFPVIDWVLGVEFCYGLRPAVNKPT